MNKQAAISFRIDAETKKELEHLAAQMDRSLAWYLCDVIEKHLAELKKRRAKH